MKSNRRVTRQININSKNKRRCCIHPMVIRTYKAIKQINPSFNMQELFTMNLNQLRLAYKVATGHNARRHLSENKNTR
jgi:hypothetical protein